MSQGPPAIADRPVYAPTPFRPWWVVALTQFHRQVRSVDEDRWEQPALTSPRRAQPVAKRTGCSLASMPALAPSRHSAPQQSRSDQADRKCRRTAIREIGDGTRRHYGAKHAGHRVDCPIGQMGLVTIAEFPQVCTGRRAARQP